MAEILNLQESLPIGIELAFNNLVNETGTGSKTVYCLWDRPLITYDLQRQLPDTYQEIKDYLFDFYQTVKGMTDLFLYQDPVDFNCTETWFEGLYNDDTRGYVGRNVGQIQLFKQYRLEGSLYAYRPITRPANDGNFKLFEDGVELLTGYTLDYDTGQLTISGVNPSSEYTWSGNFYVPVRFNNKTLEFIKECLNCGDTTKSLYTIPSFELIEVKEKFINLSEPPTIPDYIDHNFSIQVSVKEKESININSQVKIFDSGYEIRDLETVDASFEPYRKIEYLTSDIPDLTQQELNYLITFWRCTRGGAISFNHNELIVQGRDSLILDVKLEAIPNCPNLEVVIDAASLKFIESDKTVILTTPTLPEFLINTTNFEISDFGITDNAQTIESNSYTTYGGGSSGGSSNGSSGGFGSSFGSANISLNNVSGGYPPYLQSLNFIDGTPVLSVIGFQNVSGSSNDRRYPLIGILSNSQSESFITFDLKDPFNQLNPDVASNLYAYADYNSSINSQLISVGNKLFTIADDKASLKVWAYSVEKVNKYIVFNSIVVDSESTSNNFQSSEFIYTDGTRVLYPFTSINTIGRFNSFQLSQTEISSINQTSNISLKIIPRFVIKEASFSPDDWDHLKPYTIPFYYVDGNTIKKAISNSESEILYEYNLIVNGLGFVIHDFGDNSQYMLFRIQSDNYTFPHDGVSTGGTLKEYIIVAHLDLQISQELNLIGSLDLDVIASSFGLTSSQVYSFLFGGFNHRNLRVCKGLLVSRNGYLIDLQNGGIINLKNNPNFFQDSSLIINADKNGFSFYSTSSNSIGYLAVNRA